MLIQIADIDLTKPLQPIYMDWRYHRLNALLWWGRQPLGILVLPCPHNTRTFSVEYLEEAIQQQFGWQIWEKMVAGSLNELNEQHDALLPPISVIVCTRDRHLALERCLHALAQLDYPDYEVVVVDNCSRTLGTRRIVSQSGFRYVREDRPGLDWARNRGIEEAQYDIIAYVDDDALASPSWLRGIAHAFTQQDIMAVTGIVLPAEIETRAQLDFESYGGMSKGFIGYTIRRNELSQRDQFRASNWGVGANMAFRRSVFEAVGVFDIALDVGTATNGGGDIEFFYRVVAAGHALRYEPAAVVRHVHRRDSAALERQIYNNGHSYPAYLMTIARNEPHRRRAVRQYALRWWLWEWLFKRLLTSLVRRDKWTYRMALTELKGVWSARRGYREAQETAARQLA